MKTNAVCIVSKMGQGVLPVFSEKKNQARAAKRPNCFRGMLTHYGCAK
jgi:hypothetical protein